jgi:dUTP pyrophosphatase
MSVFIRKLTETSQVPKRATEGSAGYDIASDEDVVIDPGERSLVKTGFSVRVPDGTYGRVAPRSGLAVKHGIDVLAGVIDRDYTGEVGVVLINHGDVSFEVKRGDRIAQLVFEKIATPRVTMSLSLEETSRGSGGFGSTGTD